MDRVGFAILAGAFICLWLMTALKGQLRLLMLVSSVLMTAGCGAMSIATPYNMSKLWGILIVAGLGIGGIVVPASIAATIVCPDDLIATVAALTLAIRVVGGSVGRHYPLQTSTIMANSTQATLSTTTSSSANSSQPLLITSVEPCWLSSTSPALPSLRRLSS